MQALFIIAYDDSVPGIGIACSSTGNGLGFNLSIRDGEWVCTELSHMFVMQAPSMKKNHFCGSYLPSEASFAALWQLHFPQRVSIFQT